MISEFSLDKDFFASAVLNDESISVVHDYLTKSWVDFGALILPKNGGEEFLALIDSLPVKFRQRWVDAFYYGKRAEVDREWWEFGGYESFEKLCELNSVFKTAFTDESVGFVLSGDETSKKICKETGFEMLGAGVCSESWHIGNSLYLSRSDILESDTAESVWENRFAGLARFSKKITIVDRYFFESIWRSAQSNKIDPALNNFFKFLSLLGKKFNVKIISHGGERYGEFHCAVSSVFQKARMKSPKVAAAFESLTLISSTEDFFKRESHDRFIGFDRHVCQVGNGMRVLGDAPLPRSTFAARLDILGELATREASASTSVFKLWSETD
ncbi:hypothetical protein HX787_00390 [Pseudomonas tolaasii]|uniref:Uncharacterized protein n=2 Tax=Pseudomonas tolaasii TaxID=29442 RepID=A0A7Y8AIZ2_PSETO|nr:hypothetical protein [Pseudomonas tolaasii]KAB0467854.1 hypothetical protein F7R12_24380 [Pseudomonas tolaasii]MBY8943583.1 hypothetical protein [Pseudomonas tolaasii]NWC19332.1 hypothetical protein [Pseudomonas tolaasii]NWC43151.1 hypothetical protein [Pseudomonas tolaasii]NWD34299.1 hypothetical protein [Pseudomonas tolaasii]